MAKQLHQSGPLNTRIKRMMQSDEDVGKVAKASTVVIATALEAFLAGLVAGAAEQANNCNARTLTNAHLKAHITSDPLLDFCLEAVADAPDLAPAGEESNAAPTRTRRAPAQQAGGAKRRRGGGRAGGAKSRTEDAEVASSDLSRPDQEGPLEEQAPLSPQEQGHGGAGEAQAGPTAADASAGEVDPLPGGIPSFLMAARDGEEEDYDD